MGSQLLGLSPHILERANRSQGRDAKPRADAAFAAAEAWLPKGQCGSCAGYSALPDLLDGERDDDEARHSCDGDVTGAWAGQRRNLRRRAQWRFVSYP